MLWGLEIVKSGSWLFPVPTFNIKSGQLVDYTTISDYTEHIRKTDKERQMVSVVFQMAYKWNFMYIVQI